MLLLFACLVLIPLALNGYAFRGDIKRYADAFGAALMIVGIWAVTNTLGFVFEPPASKAIVPLIDFAAGATMITAWVSHKERWKLILAGLFLGQCVIHAMFWIVWLNYPSTDMLWRYQLALNVSWLLELCVVASPGVGNVAGRSLAWLRHRPVPHHRPRPY